MSKCERGCEYCDETQRAEYPWIQATEKLQDLVDELAAALEACVPFVEDPDAETLEGFTGKWDDMERRDVALEAHAALAKVGR